MGDRPEWPPSNPPYALLVALWEHVESCWHQEPMVRPTALNMLEIFGEARGQESVTSMEGVEEDLITGEWERIKSASWVHFRFETLRMAVNPQS